MNDIEKVISAPRRLSLPDDVIQAGGAEAPALAWSFRLRSMTEFDYGVPELVEGLNDRE